VESQSETAVSRKTPLDHHIQGRCRFRITDLAAVRKNDAPGARKSWSATLTQPAITRASPQKKGRHKPNLATLFRALLQAGFCQNRLLRAREKANRALKIGLLDDSSSQNATLLQLQGPIHH
jgi:hypothetical protein